MRRDAIEVMTEIDSIGLRRHRSRVGFAIPSEPAVRRNSVGGVHGSGWG